MIGSPDAPLGIMEITVTGILCLKTNAQIFLAFLSIFRNFADKTTT